MFFYLLIILGVIQPLKSSVSTILEELRQIEDQISLVEQKIKVSKPLQLPPDYDFNDQSLKELEEQFMSGINFKNSWLYEGKNIQDCSLMNMRSFQYPNTNLLFCIEDKINVVAINMKSKTLAKWGGNTNITFISVNFFGEDIIVGILDEQYKVTTLSLKEITIDDIGLDSQGKIEVLDFSQLNDFTLEKEDNLKYNCMIMNFARNSHVYLFGDSKGQISSFFANGTFRGKALVSRNPIKFFVKRHPHIIFASKNYFGFINSISLQVAQPLCEKTPEDILEITQDTAYSNQIFVLLTNMEIMAFQVKHGKANECQINFKIHAPNEQYHDGKSKFKLALINNFLILNEESSTSLNIFNVSSFKQRTFEEDQIQLCGLENNLQNQSYDNYQLFSSKKSSTNSYVFLVQHSNEGSEVKLYEVTHQVPQAQFQFSFFESFRFPLILVTLFVIFIFQYFQRKRKDDPEDDERIQMAKRKIDSMVEEYQNARKYQSNNPQENKKMNSAKKFYENSDEFEEISYRKNK